jgi:hypothetical protein
LPYILSPHWLNDVVIQIGYRFVPYLQVLLLLAVLGTCLWRIRRTRSGGPRLVSPRTLLDR